MLEIYKAIGSADLVELEYQIQNNLIEFICNKDKFFVYAVSIGNLSVIKFLVEKCGCDPSANNDDAIVCSARDGNMDVLKYLVSLGCDFCNQDYWAFNFSAMSGKLEIVKYFIEIGVDPTINDNIALKTAVTQNRVEVVNFLLSMDCYPQVRDEYCETDFLTYVEISIISNLFLHLMKKDKSKYLEKMFEINKGKHFYIEMSARKALCESTLLKKILKPTSMSMILSYL
jgi:ankyrin repeat protein